MHSFQFFVLFFFALFVFSNQQHLSEDDLSGYLTNDDFVFLNNSTEYSTNDSMSDSLQEYYPFTTKMFPIEVSNHSGLPSNIKLETESAEVPRKHPARAYNPRPVYVNANEVSNPIPLTEHLDTSSNENYHRDNNELVEERYNFGSYDFFRKRQNHEYHHQSKESRERSNEVIESAECPRLPQIIRLKEPIAMNGVQMVPWMPLNDKSGEIIQQNWWIERADPAANDTVITYGQMRRHKV